MGWVSLLNTSKIALFDEFTSASQSTKLGGLAMLQNCLQNPEENYPYVLDIVSDNETHLSLEEIDASIIDLGFRVIFSKVSEHYSSKMYSNQDNSCLGDILYDNKEKTVDLSFISINREWDTKFDRLLEVFAPKKEDQNEVFVLISSRDGMKLESIGSIAEPLTRENYNTSVLENYDFIVENIGAKKPKGRLSILNGPPGTGKTHLIKGLIQEMETNCNFIIVSPDMVTQLTGPSFIKCLIDLKDPIVLVLEDADQCLTRKARDNMSEIQTVLNFADGIVGQLLDLRLVVTSNVDTQEFDKAILRPGRLCRHVELGPLGVEEANRLFATLGGEGEPFKVPTTLAEVYGALSGVVEEVKETRKLGF